MKVSTQALAKATSIVGKCKPNNLLPISSYYELKFNKEGLTLTVTDGSASISASIHEGATDEEQKVVVKSETFSKLISKTTTEYINLNIKNGYLEIKGNGTYKVELFEDEDYPGYTFEEHEVFKVNANELKQGLQVGKYTKSLTASDGVLYSYLVRDGYIVATDGLKISTVAVKGLDVELLIPPNLAVLVDALQTDTCTLALNEAKTEVLISNDNVVIYGSLSEGAEEFPDVTPLFEDDYAHSFELDILSAVQTLERLKLFASSFEAAFVDAVFGSDYVIFSNDNSQEEIKYNKGVDEAIGIACTLNIKHLQDVLKSIKGQSVVVNINDDADILYLECGKDKFILSTVEGDE